MGKGAAAAVAVCVGGKGRGRGWHVGFVGRVREGGLEGYVLRHEGAMRVIMC